MTLSENSRRSHENAKKEDPEKYKARVNQKRKKYMEKHPDREKANGKRSEDMGVESQIPRGWSIVKKVDRSSSDYAVSPSKPS